MNFDPAPVENEFLVHCKFRMVNFGEWKFEPVIFLKGETEAFHTQFYYHDPIYAQTLWGAKRKYKRWVNKHLVDRLGGTVIHWSWEHSNEGILEMNPAARLRYDEILAMFTKE